GKRREVPDHQHARCRDARRSDVSGDKADDGAVSATRHLHLQNRAPPHYAPPSESAKLSQGQRSPPGREAATAAGTTAMMRIIRCALALIALLACQTSLARAAEEVDLLLVLASDVSRSVDHPKFLLQRDGYAAAMSSPQVIDAIKSGPTGKIAVNFLEWSGYGAQKIVVDWTIIDSAASGRRMGDLIVEAPRSFADRT